MAKTKNEQEVTETMEEKIVPPPVTNTQTVIQTKPHVFYVEQMTRNAKIKNEKEEYQDLKDRIEDSENEGRREILHKGDLRDYAWQKLSQEGYRLKRNINPENPNDINFVITW